MKLPFPEAMLRDNAKPGCPSCHGLGTCKAITQTRILFGACTCAIKRIMRQAKKLNKFADMLNTQES